MPPRGNFDREILHSLNPRPGTKEYLKLTEADMEPPRKNRKRVMMEKDKREQDYPHTRKYNYVRPDEQRPRRTEKQVTEDYLDRLLRESEPKGEKEILRKETRPTPIADEGPDPFDILRNSPVPAPSPGAKEKAVHKGISSMRASKGLDDLKNLIKKMEQ